MHNPVFFLQNFGAFDYAISNPQQREGPQRSVSSYEFEFYTETQAGGLRIEGKFYQACRGGCLLAKPGQIESVVMPYRGYYMNIVTQDPQLCEMLDHLPSCFTLWNMGEVIKLFHQIISTENRSSLVSKLQIHSLVCRILAILHQYQNTPAKTDSKMLQHQKMLLKADNYMRDHLSEDLSLNALAKLCNLDPTYFHKLYTAAFGATPAQRILGYRIAAAKTGLIENKLSLVELATKCGFSSQTYFCYKFRQVSGQTPLEYRRQMLSHPKK